MDGDYAALMARFQDGPILSEVVDRSHALILVVDGQRRIVYGSRGMMNLAGIDDIGAMLGRTPGDFFRCINARNAVCGESLSCSECGALFGISLGLGGVSVDSECFLTLSNQERLQARDFHIRATPLDVDGTRFVVLSLQDIGHEKRRKALEQVFLHDILNSVGAVKGILHFLHGELSGEHRTLLGSILPYFDSCVDEIAAQRKLLAAENNDLVLSNERFSLAQMLQGLVNVHAQHSLGQGKALMVDVADDADEMIGDRVIINRIMTNLLKNALEATQVGDRITLAASRDGDSFRLTVSNPGVMPLEVQRQLFRRSFSTKGEGRGLGTYSVHLLCANYLRGKVEFESTPERGTIFSVRIPQGSSFQN